MDEVIPITSIAKKSMQVTKGSQKCAGVQFQKLSDYLLEWKALKCPNLAGEITREGSALRNSYSFSRCSFCFSNLMGPWGGTPQLP